MRKYQQTQHFHHNIILIWKKDVLLLCLSEIDILLTH